MKLKMLFFFFINISHVYLNESVNVLGATTHRAAQKLTLCICNMYLVGYHTLHWVLVAVLKALPRAMQCLPRWRIGSVTAESLKLLHPLINKCFRFKLLLVDCLL